MKIYVSWDYNKVSAYNVCVHSLLKYSQNELDIYPLKQDVLRSDGLYTKSKDLTATIDIRFLVPHLADYNGWVLFVDCDFFFMTDVKELFNLIDDKYAVMCIHDQKQVLSSMVLWNCSHPANASLTPDVVNRGDRAFLHGFKWLEDVDIGEIPLEWNWLENEKGDISPAAINFTNCQNVNYSDLWRKILEECYIDLYIQFTKRYIKRYDGTSLYKEIDNIRKLVIYTKSETFLDFGCGNGKQYYSHRSHLRMGVKSFPYLYDPSFEKHNVFPTEFFDGVVCTDVMEHIPEEIVPFILERIFSVARKFVYFSISTRLASAVLLNGENAHCTIKEPSWWKNKIENANKLNVLVNVSFLGNWTEFWTNVN